jgi:hypothetical protein
MRCRWKTREHSIEFGVKCRGIAYKSYAASLHGFSFIVVYSFARISTRARHALKALLLHTNKNL